MKEPRLNEFFRCQPVGLVSCEVSKDYSKKVSMRNFHLVGGAKQAAACIIGCYEKEIKNSLTGSPEWGWKGKADCAAQGTQGSGEQQPVSLQAEIKPYINMVGVIFW